MCKQRFLLKLNHNKNGVYTVYPLYTLYVTYSVWSNNKTIMEKQLIFL